MSPREASGLMAEALTFEGGLVTQTERTGSPPNTLRELINWVPEPGGGLRVRTGWESTNSVSVAFPGFGTVMPLALSYDARTDRLYLGNASASGTLRLIYSAPTAGVFTVTESVSGLSAPADAPGALEDYPVAMIPDNPGHWSHPWMTYRAFGAAVGSNPGAVRALAKHRGRYYAAAPAGALTTLRYSDIENPASWPAGNTIIVGTNTLEALCPVEEGLLIGAQGEIHLLRGTGPDNYNLIQLQGGDCMRGRSMISTPYGVIIVGRTDMFIWQGGPVVPIDRGVDTQMTGKWCATAYKKGKVLVGDVRGANPKLIWVYDLENRSWTQERFGSAGTTAPQVFVSPPGYTGDYVFGAADMGVSYSPVMWRHPERTRQLDAAILTPDQLFRARTQGLYLGSAKDKAQSDHLFLRVYQRGPNDVNHPFTVTPIVDGSAKAARTIEQRGVGVHRHRVDLGHDGYEFQFLFEHTPATTFFADNPYFDIEEAVLSYQPAGVS